MYTKGKEVPQEEMAVLQQWVDESHRIVFFGGAGMSTESGIPDFRSTDGLYSETHAFAPETILSAPFYRKNPEAFFSFYRERMLCLDVQPNAGHRKLAQLEAVGKLSAVVTQNIDGLHQAAGSLCVLELHGSVHRNRCQRCAQLYGARFIQESTGVPHCPCGGQIKPEVVLYGEPLDDATMRRAVECIAQADMLIVGGTSLSVYPAAGLIEYYRGGRMVLLNRTPTPADSRGLVLRGSIGSVLGALEVC